MNALLVFPIGMTFGEWSVMGAPEKVGRQHAHPCECRCGHRQFVRTSHLTSGSSLRCIRCQSAKASLDRTKHLASYGGPDHATYRVWSGMRTRCLNTNQPVYKDYGGRGISICDAWNVFENFLRDMGRVPAIGMSIERKDVNGNYEKENCVWATSTRQARNRRNTIWVIFEGQRMPFADAMELLGHRVNDNTYRRTYRRIRRGVSFQEALR